MSQLNPKNNAAKAGLVKPNHEGSVQTVKSAEQQLLEIAVMTLWGRDSFYESTDDRLVRIRELVNKVVAKGNPDFVANVIRYARTEMHMRSVPLVIAIVFAEALRDNFVKYTPLRRVICDVIQRVDQINDVYAVALGVFGDKKNIPVAIKRGVADAFNKFNEYQFGKWNRANAVKLRDVLRIVHPNPKTKEQSDLFDRIMKDTVAIPDTHEVLFSVNGQLPVDQRRSNDEIWTELIETKKLGYQATLMNIRRMLNDKLNVDTLKLVATRLTQPAEVAKSKMLPFQFVAAYNAVMENKNAAYSNLIINAVSDAIDLSLTNMPTIGDNIIIIVDLSASMRTYTNARNFNTDGTIQRVGTPSTISALFTAALYKANIESRNIAIVGFSDNASFVQVNSRDSIVTMREKVLSQTRAGGTNLYGALEFIKEHVHFTPDTVILLSDMQIQDAASDRWNVRQVAVDSYFPDDCMKIAVNLDAYETTPVSPYKGWIQLCGWSPRIFDMIPALRESRSKTAVNLLSGPY